MFKLTPNYSLQYNNSFGLDVYCSYWLSIGCTDDWLAALERYPHLKSERRMIVGDGSNLLFLKDFDGLIVSPDLMGITIRQEHDDWIEIEAGAGVAWDDLVAECVEKGWYGLENMSLIPGRVGSAAYQNIGAYGVEVGQYISVVNCFDLSDATQFCFSQEACRFGYRTSLFKQDANPDRLITSVVFRLRKDGRLITEYGDLQKIVADFGEVNLQNIRKAVIHIRKSKLPDPRIQGNAGSFFMNPLLSKEDVTSLADFLPGLPRYPQPDGSEKVAAGYLIDQAGWRGKKMGRAAVHERQALVLVNLGGATGEEVMRLSRAIQQDILEKFGVVLEREVQVVE